MDNNIRGNLSGVIGNFYRIKLGTLCHLFLSVSHIKIICCQIFRYYSWSSVYYISINYNNFLISNFWLQILFALQKNPFSNYLFSLILIVKCFIRLTRSHKSIRFFFFGINLYRSCRKWDDGPSHGTSVKFLSTPYSLKCFFQIFPVHVILKKASLSSGIYLPKIVPSDTELFLFNQKSYLRGLMRSGPYPSKFLQRLTNF